MPMCEKCRTHRLQLRRVVPYTPLTTDGIRRLRHHGTSLSISTVSLVYPVSQTLRRLQSLMTQSAPTAVPGLQQSSPAYQKRSVVSAGRIRRVPQWEIA